MVITCHILLHPLGVFGAEQFEMNQGCIWLWVPSILLYKAHPIPKHKRFPSRYAVVFAQSIEATC